MTTQRPLGTWIAGLTVAVGLVSSGTADAEPLPPPPGPTIPLLGAPLGPPGIAVLGQNGIPAVDGLGTPALAELKPQHALGQNPIPSPPGGPPGTGPNFNAFNNGYWLPQNVVPSAPGEGTVVGVAPGEENADIGRIDWLRQLHEMYRNGNFEGAALGQLPKEQLGAPWPGTAPLPFTNLPPGVVQPAPIAPAEPAPQ
jgi:hypothetical protein